MCVSCGRSAYDGTLVSKNSPAPCTDKMLYQDSRILSAPVVASVYPMHSSSASYFSILQVHA